MQNEPTPAEILTAAAARKGWSPQDIEYRLSVLGCVVTAATVRNWLADRSIPHDAARLALVPLFGLERDGFMVACASSTVRLAEQRIKKEW